MSKTEGFEKHFQTEVLVYSKMLYIIIGLFFSSKEKSPLIVGLFLFLFLGGGGGGGLLSQGILRFKKLSLPWEKQVLQVNSINH